jgi:hypothetical protein
MAGGGVLQSGKDLAALDEHQVRRTPDPPTMPPTGSVGPTGGAATKITIYGWSTSWPGATEY